MLFCNSLTLFLIQVINIIFAPRAKHIQNFLEFFANVGQGILYFWWDLRIFYALDQPLLL